MFYNIQYSSFQIKITNQNIVTDYSKTAVYFLQLEQIYVHGFSDKFFYFIGLLYKILVSKMYI